MHFVVEMPVAKRQGRPGIVRRLNTTTERCSDAKRKEAATQRRAVLFSSQPSQEQGEDPASAYYKDDRVLRKLELDVAARVKAFQQAWLCSHMCLFPTYALCTNLICCTTCYMYDCFPQQEAKVAAAHRLTLREKTLLIEIDRHWNYSITNRVKRTGPYVPTCCEPGGVCPDSTCGVEIHRYVKVLRLAEGVELRLEAGTPSKICCLGDSITPDQLVVSIGGAVVTAFAGPKDPMGFIAAVAEQKARVLEEGIDSDSPINMLSPFMGRVRGGGQSGAGVMRVGQLQHPVVQAMQRDGPKFASASPSLPVAEIVATVVASTCSAPDVAGGLSEVAQLYRDGFLSKEEFDKAKANILER